MPRLPAFRLALLFLLLAGGLVGATETLAERSLREILTREEQLFARAEREGDELDEARFATEAQALAASYDVLIQKNPDFVAGYVAYGLFLGRVDMPKAAVAMLLRANRLDSNLPVVKNQLAKHLAEDGRPLEALPYLMSAVDLAPNEPLYHFHLAKLLLEAREEFLRGGEWTRAALERAMLEGFRRAADLAPGEFALAYQHAKAFYELDPPRWDEALAAWEALEPRATSTAVRQLVQLQQAHVLARLGRTDEARTRLAAVREPQFDEEKAKVAALFDAPPAPPATGP